MHTELNKKNEEKNMNEMDFTIDVYYVEDELGRHRFLGVADYLIETSFCNTEAFEQYLGERFDVFEQLGSVSITRDFRHRFPQFPEEQLLPLYARVQYAMSVYRIKEPRYEAWQLTKDERSKLSPCRALDVEIASQAIKSQAYIAHQLGFKFVPVFEDNEPSTSVSRADGTKKRQTENTVKFSERRYQVLDQKGEPCDLDVNIRFIKERFHGNIAAFERDLAQQYPSATLVGAYTDFRPEDPLRDVATAPALPKRHYDSNLDEEMRLRLDEEMCSRLGDGCSAVPGFVVTQDELFELAKYHAKKIIASEFKDFEEIMSTGALSNYDSFEGYHPDWYRFAQIAEVLGHEKAKQAINEAYAAHGKEVEPLLWETFVNGNSKEVQALWNYRWTLDRRRDMEAKLLRLAEKNGTHENSLAEMRSRKTIADFGKAMLATW
jgi:hypothetical protein